ncbi:restriction endonuclease subunit S [Geobacillus sp. CAMR5420]|uniref:restriction endonuclease subunit S n=1 Tax=Geobacillus TaxID=129337 RepID=UPI0018E3F8B2|nr:restriction endonuclease subunit S [Geobacillus sp. CAMR5420]
MSEWKNCLLGDVVEYANGSSFPNEFQGKKNGKYDFYKVSDMNNPKNSVFMTEAENTVDDETVTELKAKIHPKDTVIFPKVGAALLTNKRRILSKPSLFDNNIMGLKAKKSILPKYLYYFMHTIDFGKFVQSGAVPSINKTIVDNIPIKLPSLFEQHKIAAILSSVDEAIEKTEAIIEQTEKVKKGLMQQLLTKGIGHTKFKKTEIGEIPEEWQIFALGDLCLLGPQNGVYKEKSEYGRGYQIVVLNDLYENEYFIAKPLDNLIDLSDKELSNYSLQEDDILVNRVSKQVEGVAKMTLFKLNNNKAVFESNMIRIRLDTKKCLPLFCLFFSHSDIYKKQIMKVAKVSSQTSISQDGIKNIRVPVPPITEQYQIVSIIESIIQKEDKEKEKLNYLQKFKKGLMQVLLTGKVRVKVDDEVMSQ